jgi:hypothetical protein
MVNSFFDDAHESLIEINDQRQAIVSEVSLSVAGLCSIQNRLHVDNGVRRNSMNSGGCRGEAEAEMHLTLPVPRGWRDGIVGSASASGALVGTRLTFVYADGLGQPVGRKIQ